MLNSGQDGGKADRTAGVTVRDQWRRVDQRGLADGVLAMAVHLGDEDRFLIEQVFDHGIRMSDIARQRGRSRSTVQYHVKKILIRIRSPLFRFLVGHGDLLLVELRRTGKAVILEGRPLREAAQLLGLSLHTVRQHLAAIQALARL